MNEQIEIGGVVYVKRQYTPKRKGEHAGHGWVRDVAQETAVPHRSEVSAPIALLIDEVLLLRELAHECWAYDSPWINFAVGDGERTEGLPGMIPEILQRIRPLGYLKDGGFDG